MVSGIELISAFTERDKSLLRILKEVVSGPQLPQQFKYLLGLLLSFHRSVAVFMSDDAHQVNKAHLECIAGWM